MTTIRSQTLGPLERGDFDDWWKGASRPIPFLDGAVLEITYVAGDDDVAHGVPDDVDAAMAAFLALGNTDRLAISRLVHANCTEFLDAVEYDEEDAALWAIETPDQIWSFVHPDEIFIERRGRRDRDVYVSVQCNCDWEREHGLQLVFRRGRQLTRVSAQDGHLTEADAYDRPDEGDALLIAFRP